MRDNDQLAINKLHDPKVAELTSVARTLDPSEREFRRRAGPLVNKNHAGFYLRGKLLGAFMIFREYRSTEAVWRVIG